MGEHVYPRYALNRGIRYRIDSPLSRPQMLESTEKWRDSLSWATEAAIAGDDNTEWLTGFIDPVQTELPNPGLLAAAEKAVKDMRDIKSRDPWAFKRVEMIADSLASAIENAKVQA